MVTDPFTHPWLSASFADPGTASAFDAANVMAHMLNVEATYAEALGAVGQIDPQLAADVAGRIRDFVPDLQGLKAGAGRDGLVVPTLVAQLRAALPETHHVGLHKGMTSQDVIDTALVLTLRSATETLRAGLMGLKSALQLLSKTHGASELTGRTRMQAALPITAHDRIDSWLQPLDAHLLRLHDISPRLFALQLGGPVGNRASLGPNAAQIATAMANALGLTEPGAAWHNDRSTIVDYAGWLSLVSGHLGKFGQDITLMAQQGIDEIALSGGGGSSAMPHKQNPVLAETLVTLARFNATQVAGMHHALIHEQERSGAAWSLEWMILPNMVQTTGRGLSIAMSVCESIQRIGHADPDA